MTINFRTDYALLHMLDLLSDEYEALSLEERQGFLDKLEGCLND